MKKTLSLLTALLMLLPLCASCTTKEKSVITPSDGETVLYVSTDGDDSADGSFAAPLATLEGAKDKVRTILPDAPGAVTVYFRGGDYLMTEGVTFDEADSGKEGSPVKYAAYPDEEVRFIGGVKVDPSLIKSADPASSVTARVKDEAAKAALMQADVSSLIDVYPEIYALGKEANNAEQPVEIYLGDTPITPARYPNRAGDYDFNYLMTTDEFTSYEDYSCDIHYDDETAARVNTWSDESLGDAYLFGFFPWEWLADTFAPTEINREEQMMHIPGATHRFFRYMAGSCRYYFENIPEEIDLPGESYVDRTAKIAYFYPTEDFDGDDVWISTLLEPMITFSGASYLSFEGLELCYMRGYAVYADGVSDTTFSDCTIAHTSERGMRIWNAMRFVVDGCEIYDTAAGGIMIEGGDRKNLISSECKITNCDIHDICRGGQYWDPDAPEYDGGTYLNSCIGGFAVGLEISHNKLHDVPHQVIALTSNDIVVEYNEIYNCVREASDMNAVGAWKNPTILGLVIRYNYFHDIGSMQNDGGQHAVYFDDGAMGGEFYGNLFVDAGGRKADMEDFHAARCAIMMHSAQYNHIHNNIFVDSQAAFRFVSWSNGSKKQPEWMMGLYGIGPRTNIRFETYAEVDFDSDLWREHYAGTVWAGLYDCVTTERLLEYAALSRDEAERKCRGTAPYLTNEADGNVYAGIPMPNAGDAVNEHDNVTFADKSIFVDADNGDYTLTAEALSEIRSVYPDFEELPLDQMGIQK